MLTRACAPQGSIYGFDVCTGAMKMAFPDLHPNSIITSMVYAPYNGTIYTTTLESAITVRGCACVHERVRGCIHERRACSRVCMPPDLLAAPLPACVPCDTGLAHRWQHPSQVQAGRQAPPHRGECRWWQWWGQARLASVAALQTWQHPRKAQASARSLLPYPCTQPAGQPPRTAPRPLFPA